MTVIKINKLKIVGIICCLLSVFSVLSQNRAEWMQVSRFGVMHQYLADWVARAENLEMNNES